MTPPALEIADLIHSWELPSSSETVSGSVGSMSKYFWLLRGVVRLRLAGISMSASAAAHRTPISYNSCRDRHCPKCQTAAREKWIAARQKELLPTRYLHVVFTLPRRLAPLVLQNKKVIYDLLFRAVRRPCLKWLAIPDTSVQRLVSSVCCTPGTKSSGSIRMSIVWFPLVVSPSITLAGSARRTTTSCPKGYYARFSVASSSQLSGGPSGMASSASPKT